MSVNARERLHLAMSDAAYQKKDALSKVKAAGWKAVSKLSGGETTAFVKGKQVVVAFRGTMSRKDFHTDIKAVAFNKPKQAGQDQRFIAAAKDFKRIKDAHPGKRFLVTGHSLGGTLAIFIGRLECIGGTAFNPGSSPVGGLTEFMDREAKKARQLHGKKSRTACIKVKILRIANEKKTLANDPVSANARKNFKGNKVKDLDPGKALNPLNHHFTTAFEKFM